MNTIKAEFDGTYNKKCLYFNKMVGSILCVGHPHLKIPKCEFCKGHTENNSYYLPILNETTRIVDTVQCSFEPTQLTLF
jgi:hypothetical protein